MKSRFVVVILGVFVFIIAVALGWTVYAPNEQEASMDRDNAQKAQAEGDKKNLAQERVELAKKEVKAVAARWREIESEKTPSTSLANGGINLDENGWQLTVDTTKYRNSLQREVNAQVKKGGVKVVEGPFVTMPSTSGSTILADYFNYPAIPFPVVIFDLGQVQVQGTWNQIMQNVESWENMPHYLAVADGLTVTGTSPYLTGTYNVSIVGYIRDNKLYPPVPSAPSSSSTTGFGGMGGPMGMMGGGRPGMPPGVPPGVPGGPMGMGGGRPGMPPGLPPGQH